MKINHLIDEKSPYLLQHAHNPVDWYPWGEIAFQKAKQEDKPVLLSVGYSTCHWCHVMAHESFEDISIAKIINDHFIAIKVDREERPDIDHVYMSAVTAMTGQGGWPLTVFLTPQGDAFYGGTYFPPYAKWGSAGFADVLNSMARQWKQDRDNILSSGRSMTEALRRQALRHPDPPYFLAEKDLKMSEDSSPFGLRMTTKNEYESLFDRAYQQMKGQFDSTNGGFGSAPKFPMGHNLSFLLRYYKDHGSPEALDMVNKTLTAMSDGGIGDHLGGGFHRYSTDQYWHVPHFEKMLYDQALLSRVYLEAYQVTGLMEYASLARSIFDYVLESMTDKLGGFYSAEDADSQECDRGRTASSDGLTSPVSGHLKEGAFYVFSHSEITEVLGHDAAMVFNYCYGVLPQGNVGVDPHGEFQGKNILYRARSLKEAADKFDRPIDDVQGLLTSSKLKLLSLRAQRPRPHKDDKVLCDWNGLMIASFAFASRVLGELKYVQAASKAADFILAQMMVKKRLLHRWRDGSAGIAATLEDYSFFIYGLLELYEATFQDKYLDAAQDLAEGMIKYFGDHAGGFYMTASDAESLIIRPKEIYDGALPSGNSVAALILVRLYALTKKDIYNTQAEALFRSFAPTVAQAPYAHCFLLSALDWYLNGPIEITFVGEGSKPSRTDAGEGLEPSPTDNSTLAKMLKVLYKYFIPSKAVKLIPALPEGGPSLNRGQVQICYQGTCGLPIDSVNDFEDFLVKQDLNND